MPELQLGHALVLEAPASPWPATEAGASPTEHSQAVAWKDPAPRQRHPWALLRPTPLSRGERRYLHSLSFDSFKHSAAFLSTIVFPFLPSLLRSSNHPWHGRTDCILLSGQLGSLPWPQPPTAIWSICRASGVGTPSWKARIGVHDVVGLIVNGASVDDVVRSFPDLTRAQVYECLAYYEDHRPEIDTLVARQMSGLRL